MVKYVVTGGCGFLGSHIVKCILKYAPEVTEVVAYDINISHIMTMWSSKLKVVRGDVMALSKAVDGRRRGNPHRRDSGRVVQTH
ncbi:truncated 3-b-hydroxy-D 5-C27-steroid oxidoreductase-like protein [Andrias davidianus ranavirus]|uniref:3-beta-hydroxysteroid dehydrogenase n=1 Tax=Andrias davidianus ranavirus TaxID=1398177 RepID=T2C5F8_9VIRU|nr:3-beta-hydroxysteroid dehydrogenase [Andrias davidianus ranavirus]AHA42327.1 truncated 3-b-hydroxy-D 5-C27-steroid oxidoreductase-like protein [Andrias davidianus ranavirus]UYY91463.1 truncated 3-b-hydroxy-D 5-C27-steroid oxidoreductase-like protein [Percocypris pingi ranavirus]